MFKSSFQSQRARPPKAGATESPLVLDVRTPEEFAEAHVPGARNIPVDELQQRHAELGTDKRLPVVVYCRSGARSALAARMLAQLGFSQVRDIGAMSNWRA